MCTCELHIALKCHDLDLINRNNSSLSGELGKKREAKVTQFYNNTSINHFKIAYVLVEGDQ
jgi:hypothetical protein